MAEGTGSFWDGLSAVTFLNAGAKYFGSKEQTKVAKIEAQTKAAEDLQRAAVESAKLERQAQMDAANLTRRTFNNEQMWKLASWFTLAVSSSLVGAVVLKILNAKV